MSNSSGKVAVSAVTSTELGHLDGVTSAIQTQLNNKQPLDADLTTIGGLAKANGNFIVGNGTTWVVESGLTARTSLGLGSLATLSAVGSSQITDNSVSAIDLNVDGNGTTAQFLRSDGNGGFTWATPTDNNTTYSAGNGISLSGTTFSVAAGGGLTQEASGLAHANTSNQASINNSNGTVIQDVTLDDYGHVTALASANLDNRYYTESEVDGFISNHIDGIDLYSDATLVVNDATTINFPSSQFIVLSASNNSVLIQPSVYSSIEASVSGTNVTWNTSGYHRGHLEWNTGSVNGAASVNLTNLINASGIVGYYTMRISGHTSEITVTVSNPTLKKRDGTDLGSITIPANEDYYIAFSVRGAANTIGYTMEQ